MFCPYCGEDIPVERHAREDLGSNKVQILYDLRCANEDCVEYGNVITVVTIR